MALLKLSAPLPSFSVITGAISLFGERRPPGLSSLGPCIPHSNLWIIFIPSVRKTGICPVAECTFRDRPVLWNRLRWRRSQSKPFRRKSRMVSLAKAKENKFRFSPTEIHLFDRLMGCETCYYRFIRLHYSGIVATERKHRLCEFRSATIKGYTMHVKQ